MIQLGAGQARREVSAFMSKYSMLILPRNFEGLLKGTKKSIENTGPDFARFCGGGLARFSKSMEQRMRASHERKDNSTQALVYLSLCSKCFLPQAPPYASQA
jgi:hypothetical protein